MRICQPRIEGYFEQIGVDQSQPVFSWAYELDDISIKDESQTSFRIVVSESQIELEVPQRLVWDTGVIKSAASIGHLYSGRPLNGIQEYFWRAEAWSNHEQHIIGHIQRFVTGKLEHSWTGRWIGNGTDDPFYLRRSWTPRPNLAIKTAYAVVSGLGQFVFHINGQKVSDHVMSPGWTNYHKLIEYCVYDIKDLLKAGPNAVGMEVANGWYIGKSGGRFFHLEASGIVPWLAPSPKELEYHPFGKTLTAIAEIHVEYEDGTKEVVGTDGDGAWKVRRSATILANIFGSEDFDAREEPVGWTTAGYDDSSWENAVPTPADDIPAGKLSGQMQSQSAKEVYEPLSITPLRPGSVLVDMGQNMSGMLEIEVEGSAGAVVVMSMAEKLRKDTGDIEQRVDGDNLIQWGDCLVQHRYTLRGDKGGERWRQQFSYYGARYIRVDNIQILSENSNIKENVHLDVLPVLKTLRSHFITTKAPVIGIFSCSDQRLNDVYRLITQAVDSNLQSTHTDCPCYEKAAWLEASQLMAPSIMYHRDVSYLYAKIFKDIRTDQWRQGDVDRYNGVLKDYQKNGFVGSRAPVYEIKWTSIPPGDIWDIPPWASCVLIGPYHHHRFFGDVNVVRDNYGAGKAYSLYLGTRLTKEKLIEHGLGDWGNQKTLSLAKANVETATYYLDLAIVRDFAELLGFPSDASSFAAQAKDIKDNYNRRLMSYDRKTKRWGYKARQDPRLSFRLMNGLFSPREWWNGPGMTPVSQAMPLCLGMVPEGTEQDVADTLARVIQTEGWACGELSLPYVTQAMKNYGHNQALLDGFVLAKEHPSYYRFVSKGETTLPEYFVDSARSRNHDMMGSVLQWFYDGLAGLEPTRPGWKACRVRPWLGEGLTSISVGYRSASGLIEVDVERKGREVEVRLRVPPNTQAEVMLDRLVGERTVKEVVVNGRERAEGAGLSLTLGSGMHVARVRLV